MDAEKLIRAWFRSPPNPHFEDVALWVLVKEAFLVGKTRAHEICIERDQDPDRKISGLGHGDGVCAACRSWRCPECENLTVVFDGNAPECDCEGALNDEAQP